MSSGSAAHTASMPSSSSVRPRLRGAGCGASRWPRSGRPASRRSAPPTARRSGTCAPVRLSRSCACSTSTQDQRVDARDRAPVAAQRAAVLDHVVALAMCGKRLHAELRARARRAGPGSGRSTGRRPRRPCRRRCRGSARARRRGRAPPRPRPRPRARSRSARRSEAREPGADHHHVGLVCPRVGHRS